MQIKSANGREGDILALERLRERRDVPSATRSRIEAEIRLVQAGWNGERDAAYEIEFYFGRSPNWVTIHDLRLEVDGLVAQIDHLLINRLAEIWVCESKAFSEGVSVNEHGEWVRWWHGRSDGIPSPIEQNHRHIFLLERVFDDRLVRLPRRLGIVPMKPDLRSLVLVSNNARIGRPKKAIKGLDEVIKAEQLKARVFDAFDANPVTKLGRAIGKEGLEAFGRELASLHRPIEFDWAAKFGLSAPESSATVDEVPSAVQPVPSEVTRRTSGHRCVNCGVPVSFGVVKFCWNNKERFGDAIYCMSCQGKFKAAN
jgi:hypothetical protein